MTREALLTRLRLPVIAAPMFLASGLDLVRACCRAGVIGAFPAGNARPPEQFETWLDELSELQREQPNAAPYAVNFTLGRPLAENPLAQMAFRKKPPIVISSVGNPAEITKRVHDWGGLIFHDVVSVRHAEKAAEAGVDGIILVCAGAGGHAGALNPFALLPQVRRLFDGLLVLAGAISDGRSIFAARALGADLIYMGTRFLATQESMAHAEYKALLTSAQTKDIIYTPSISGLPASFIRQSIEAAGLNPEALPPPRGLHKPDLPPHIKPWKDVWSAGQGVGLIDDLPTTFDLVARLAREYEDAKQDFAENLTS